MPPRAYTLFRSPKSRPRILLVDDDALESRARKEALDRQFPSVERVRSAAEALILLEDAEVVRQVALILVELHRPELSGPDFVREVTRRAPGTRVLVLGQAGESAGDYAGNQVHFLPRTASVGEMLTAVRTLLIQRLGRAA